MSASTIKAFWGNRELTEDSVLGRIAAAIDQNNPSFKVTADNLGPDPLFGVPKIFSVYFKRSPAAPSWESRWAQDGQAVNFSSSPVVPILWKDADPGSLSTVKAFWGSWELTDEAVLRRIANAIDGNDANFQVTTGNLGSDPLPGVLKIFSVYFKRSPSATLWESRWALDGKAVDFNTQILLVTWGDAEQPLKDQGVNTKLYRLLACAQPFTVGTNELGPPAGAGPKMFVGIRWIDAKGAHYKKVEQAQQWIWSEQSQVAETPWKPLDPTPTTYVPKGPANSDGTVTVYNPYTGVELTVAYLPWQSTVDFDYAFTS